jgi:hypothetical protein
MKKLYLVCLLVLILPGFAFSQFNLQFGYGVSYCNPGDINRLIYVYNNVNRASITKEMPKVHFMHGYDLGVTFGDRFKIEIHRTSRRANVMAEGMVNGESHLFALHQKCGSSSNVNKKAALQSTALKLLLLMG